MGGLRVSGFEVLDANGNLKTRPLTLAPSTTSVIGIPGWDGEDGESWPLLIQGTTIWGGITGTLSAQSDLNSALAAKFPYTGGTLLGDLKFTDATYDIGKAGATRPRNLFLSGTLDVGGATTFPVNVWNVSSDGFKRLHFASGPGPTFIEGTGIQFRNSADANIMNITDAGVFELTLGQLRFPATMNASSDPNTLDDYEEGTWTPVGNVVTVTVNSAKYIKVGSLVFVSCDLSWPVNADGNHATISGMPFSAVGLGGAVIGYQTSGASTMVQISGTSLSLYNQTTGGIITNAQLSGGTVRMSGVYAT